MLNTTTNKTAGDFKWSSQSIASPAENMIPREESYGNEQNKRTDN